MADFLGVGTLQNEVISQNTNRALRVGTLRNEMILKVLIGPWKFLL